MYEDLKASYDRDGFITGFPVISAEEAAAHRASMEAAEAKIGKLHYLKKAHTILRSPYELATHPKLLDLVEALIGPDVLLYNATYIVKEPHSPAHVSWHQDLTYWGLSNDKQVSVWLALAPATAESGCMRMLPASHLSGRVDHEMTKDEANVLYHGQTVRGVDEAKSRICALEPGEASLHHGWTLHASGPNDGDDRRIGLNIQFLATDTRQTLHDEDSAILVRGEDRYHHFKVDEPAQSDLDPAALARRDAMEARIAAIYDNAAQA